MKGLRVTESGKEIKFEGALGELEAKNVSREFLAVISQV